MRTTLDIDDRLLAEAKIRAVREKTTLTRLIEEGLRMRMRPPLAAVSPAKIDLPSGKGGLAPGVNPLSNRSLLGEDD